MCVVGTQTKPTSTFKIYLESVYNWSSKHKICKHYQMLKMNILQSLGNKYFVCNFKMSLEPILGTQNKL